MNKKAMLFISIGFELIGLIFGSVLLGNVIDQHFRLNGVGVVSLVIAGFVGWFVRLVYVLKRLEKIEEKEESKLE